MKCPLRPPLRLALASIGAAMLFLPRGSAEPPPAVTPQTPTIPERTFTVTDFGAVGDGVTLNTVAVHKAIDACAKAKGGRVIIPEGIFLTGPFELGSAMRLHLARGATLKMSPREEDYPITGRERQGFIVATNAHDVEISGEGTIDGQGAAWWADFQKIKGTAAVNVAPRRPQMIALTRCERVRLQGITTTNPPNTHCSLRQCTEVTVDGLTMLAPDESPNTDALNLNVRNAVVKNCHIATGDDNIVFLASAAHKDGRPAVENVVVADCTLGVGHGLSIGSYTEGGIRNIAVQNVTFEGTTAGIRMKADRGRGGLVENLTFKNLVMKNVRNPIQFTSYYPKPPKLPGNDPGEAVGPKTPHWRNITIEDCTITHCPTAITLWGLPEQPITDVTFRNVNISAQTGVVIYHAKAIRFENVKVSPGKGPALTTFNAEVEGLTATPLKPRVAKP